jgi:hypothetical protein
LQKEKAQNGKKATILGQGLKLNPFPKTKKFAMKLYCMIHLKEMDNKVCWDCVDKEGGI